MEGKRLSESEYRFMSLLWDSEPIPSMKLVELCREELGWKKSTVFTVIKKLSEKGFLKNESAVVTALVPRDKAQATESGLFLERTFNGSLPGFLAAFLRDKGISGEEAERLKELIDRYRED